MANSDKNILITPSVGLSTNPTIKFNGANNTPTTLRVLDDGTVSFEGTAGQLFSISDGLTGSIFSVNDISGIPSIEVLDTGLVKLNQYGGSAVFGSSAAIQNASSVNAKVSISTASATTPGLIIKGVSSQSANLQEWQDSTGTANSWITASGSTLAFTLNAGWNINWGNTSILSMTSAALVVNPYSASRQALVIKGAASQTATLQEWQNSAGSVLSYIGSVGQFATSSSVRGSSGGIFGGNTQLSSAGLTIYATAAGNPGAIIRGAASQTANLQEWQDSSGTALSYITKDGTLDLRNTSATAFTNSNSGNVGPKIDLWGGQYGIGIAVGRMSFFTPASGGIALKQDSYSGTSVFDVAYNGATSIGLQSASAIGLVIKAAASQTANLQEWQNSAGTVLARIRENGSLNLIDGAAIITLGNNSGAQLSSAYLSVTCYPTNPGIVIRGGASQSGNLQEWQNSAGTALVKVAADGHLIVGSFNNSGWISVNPDGASRIPIRITLAASQTADSIRIDNSSNAALFRINNAGQIQPPLSASIGLVVKGLASQTGDLQQWQDSSGTVLSGVNAAGQLYSGSSSVVQSGAVGLASVTGDGTNATYTAVSGYTVANPFTAGAKVTISGYTGITGYNGTFTISSVGGTPGAYTFTVPNTTTGTPGGTGASYQSVDLSLTSKNPWSTPFVIKAAASQATNLLEFQNSSGTVLAKVESGGALNIAPTATPNGYSVYASGTGNSGVLTLRSTSTSAHLIQLANSSNTTVFKIDKEGRVAPGATTSVGLIIQGLSSQTANLQEWQDSSGNILVRIASSGHLNTNAPVNVNGFPAGLTFFGVKGDDGTVTTSIIRGATSQTANLQEWQDSAGTVLVKVRSSGQLNVGGAVAATTLGVLNIDPVWTALKVIGAASQTANLQEWQDSSGTILGGMQANGQLFGTQIKTKNAYIFIGEQNSGGSTIYTRQTATPSAPGTNAANLYFRDGTNAGTLKLVVRAGASGAETTILDNIPQS